MNVHDEMSDDEVLRAAERSMSALPMATLRAASLAAGPPR
jgi:hypothetical protein